MDELPLGQPRTQALACHPTELSQVHFLEVLPGSRVRRSGCGRAASAHPQSNEGLAAVGATNVFAYQLRNKAFNLAQAPDCSIVR